VKHSPQHLTLIHASARPCGAGGVASVPGHTPEKPVDGRDSRYQSQSLDYNEALFVGRLGRLTAGDGIAIAQFHYENALKGSEEIMAYILHNLNTEMRYGPDNLHDQAGCNDGFGQASSTTCACEARTSTSRPHPDKPVPAYLLDGDCTHVETTVHDPPTPYHAAVRRVFGAGGREGGNCQGFG
jgi:hypothetical protein